MGEFSCTIKPKPVAKKKATGAAKKTVQAVKSVTVKGATKTPARRDALVKELKKLATRYKFKVTQK